MLEQPTVFVLGAGASKEAGLPVGKDLLKQISKDTNFRQIDKYGRKISSFCPELMKAIHQFLQLPENSGVDINVCANVGRKISAAADGLISIDDVVDKLEGDLDLFVGKLAIVRVILEKETSDNFSTPQNRPLEFDLNNFDNTCFKSFGQMLVKNVTKFTAPTIGQNTTIISFNYDRTVEHFLARFFERSLDISRDESRDIVNNMDIIHPYGTVGRLEWQKNSNSQVPPIEFGGGNRPNLLAAASQIRTYTEQVEEKSVALRMCAAITGAAKLIFLGFGFHQQNMDLLQAEKPNPDCKVFATASGQSGSKIDVFRSRIKRTLLADDHISEQKGVAHRYQIVDRTCVKLFEDYDLDIAG